MPTRIANLAALALALSMLSACPLPAEATQALNAKLATDADGNPNPDAPGVALNDHANALDDAGDHERALLFYDAALARYAPEHTKLRAGCLFNKGLALRRLERWDESVAAYEASLELNPDKRGGYINISIPLASAGRVDDAVAWLDRGLARFPDDIELIETKASTLIEAERHAEARPLAERSLALREASSGRADRRYIDHWRGYLAAHPAN